MDDAWAWSILFSFATAISCCVFGYTIQMRAERRFSAAWVVFILSPFPLAVWTLAWAIMASPPESWRRVLSLVVGGVVGALMLTGATELLHGRVQVQSAPAPAPSSPSQESPIPDNKSPSASVVGSGNFSVNQQGGTINQTYVNQQPEKLKFSEQLGKELMLKVPKGKPVHINSVGSQEDSQVGKGFADFFRANGYTVFLSYTGISIPQPDAQLTLRERPDAFAITVAPSVR